MQRRTTLSPRGKRRCLVCLSAGRSNPEIADTLFISRRTVTTHVTNIFAKLGVSNRVEAVTTAQRQDCFADDQRLYVRPRALYDGRRSSRRNAI